MQGSAALVVELCGKLADAAGRELTLAIPAAGCTVAELLEQIAAARPELAAQIGAGKVRACVNEEIVRGEAPVRPGDAVALFPPVSGG